MSDDNKINNLQIVTTCDISDMMAEINRFLFHMILVHIITHVIDGKDELYGENIIRNMIITAIAIILYHIIFKKITKTKLKNIQLICDKGKDVLTNNGSNKMP